jgi:ABC-type multidrug transport system fused ATPase/permease subunit
LLDEPTSSLDSESEREVDNAIRRLCKGRTTLVVAHRLHTIVHADCIHFVEDGAIVESGGHHALMRRNGRYADLFRLQFRGGYEASLKEPGLPKLTEGNRQEHLHAPQSRQSG